MIMFVAKYVSACFTTNIKMENLISVPQLIFSDIFVKKAIVGSSNIAATKTAFPISALVPPIFVII